MSLLTRFRPSMYLSEPPDFWATDVKPWPVTGADLEGPGGHERQTLPAEDRYAQLPWRRGFGPRTPRVTPTGPTNAATGEALAFNLLSFHMDATIRLRYLVDWGDGTISRSDLLRSGTTLSMAHAWAGPGLYHVTAQARDQYGLTSKWSRAIPVKVDDPE
jgi:hypothetical protein